MNLTIDSIWSDQIKLAQSRRGYRFSLDAVLLAHHLRPRQEDSVLEIGAGNGVIAVLLSRLRRFKSLVAVEVQPELAKFCQQNFGLNGLENAIGIEADLNHLDRVFAAYSFDLIYSNPPYRKLGTGKLNPSDQKAIARHEIRMRLEDLLSCAEKFLKPDGNLSVILPHFRETDFRKLTMKYNMTFSEWRYVHSFRSEKPAFFLATVGRTAGPVLTHTPWVIYEEPGKYTKELLEMLRKP